MDTRANRPKLISMLNSIINGHAKTKMKTFNTVVFIYTLTEIVVICALYTRGAIDIAEDVVSKRLGAIERETSINWFEFLRGMIHAISIHVVHPVPMRLAFLTQWNSKSTAWNHCGPVAAFDPGL